MFVAWHLVFRSSTTLTCFQLCSAHYTVLQTKNSTSHVCINPVATENTGNKLTGGELTEAAGDEFLPLVVDNFGIWTPSSVEILHSIARISTMQNELSTGKAFRHLVERLSV